MSTTEAPENREPGPLLGLGSGAGLGAGLGACYACGKRFRKQSRPRMVSLIDDDGRMVPVGSDCYWQVVAAGLHGYKPQCGGPTLYSSQAARATAMVEAPNAQAEPAPTAEKDHDESH